MKCSCVLTVTILRHDIIYVQKLTGRQAYSSLVYDGNIIKYDEHMEFENMSFQTMLIMYSIEQYTPSTAFMTLRHFSDFSCSTVLSFS